MAANLNDLIKAVVQSDPNGNMQDGMRAYFGAGPGITLNGAILTFLQGLGATSNHLNTAWIQYFILNPTGLLGTPTLQDNQKEFWKAGGFP